MNNEVCIKKKSCYLVKSNVYFVLYIVITLLHSTSSTIDLTIPEFQYLANHLTKDECHRLITLLHFNSFELPHNVENVENAIPEDISCLKLLLHWNVSPNEGRGVTHEKVSLRLRQMGKEQLADWLDVAVLQELEEEIVNIAEEFKGNKSDKESLDIFDDGLEELFIVDFTLMDLFMIATGVLCTFAACTIMWIVGHRIYRRYRDSNLDTRRMVEEHYEDRMRGSKLFENFNKLQHLNIGVNSTKNFKKVDDKEWAYTMIQHSKYTPNKNIL